MQTKIPVKPKYGFTLLELVVVVIIIAVLSAVAWPQYKHAVLKSRFSTVMPMAKSVADAQELYYLENDEYAWSKQELSVEPVQTEKTEVILSTPQEEEDYIYVAAHRTDVPHARYIMFQRHSPKFAGNIHCEAASGDADALWLCEKGLQGQFVEGGSLQGDDYKTYLLAGQVGQSDAFGISCPQGEETQSCDCGESLPGTCNTQDGTWSYQGTCPTPLATQTEACPAGKIGTRTRTGDKCEGGSYTYNEWDESGCCPTATQTVTEACSAGYSGTRTKTATSCHNGSWEYGAWDESNCCADSAKQATQTCPSGCGSYALTATCNNGSWSYSGDASACPVKPTGGEYTCKKDGSTFTTDYRCNANGTGYESFFVSGSCTYSDEAWPWKAYEYEGALFSGSGALCHGSFYENGCANATFTANAACWADTANGCAGSTFVNASCVSYTPNGCAGIILGENAYCRVESEYNDTGCMGINWSQAHSTSYCEVSYLGYCPAGSRHKDQDGTCWDGNGGKMACPF